MSISVAIWQGLYLLGQGSFVMMLTLLSNKLLLYKFKAYQHFISCSTILFEWVEGTLSKGNKHESSFTLFLTMLLLMCHPLVLRQNRILWQKVIIFVKNVVESLTLFPGVCGSLNVTLMGYATVM